MRGDDGVIDWQQHLLAHSPGLRRHPRGATFAAVAAAALDAVDPAACVRAHTHLLSTPRGPAAVVGESVFELAGRRIWLFGAGKASEAMAAALRERFADHVAGGLIIGKHRGSPPLLDDAGPLTFALGDHPIPGEATAAASARLRAMAAQVGARDLVLCPISGGASALLSEPTIPAADWAALVRHLVARDVSIQAINRLRRRLDRLKAGGLARLFAPATVIGLILSDVVGDEPALVGSGPTVYADAGDGEQAHAALLADLAPALADLPPALRRILTEAPTPPGPPRDAAGAAQQVHQVILARNGDAREAACRRARALGLDAVIVLPALTGLARDEGRRLGTLLRQMPADLPVRPPACLITGGETTVDLRGDPASEPAGVGGRNLELALAAVEPLAALGSALGSGLGSGGSEHDEDPAGDAALLTLASDGEDGPTDAAGALVTPQTHARARALGLDPARALATHDSYRFFAALDDLLKTGPTGTNVCDLALLFRLR